MPGLPTFASSCLIAMALKNSKTGSLPVSEIYSFMKEHFPYFKVRHRSQGRGARAALTSPRHCQTQKRPPAAPSCPPRLPVMSETRQ